MFPRASPRAQRLTNACPFTCSCHPLLRCHLAALSPPSESRTLPQPIDPVAPPWLLSAVARQSTGSTVLPRPSGSALVWCRPSRASGLHYSGSTLVLCRSGSTAAFRIHISTSVSSAIGSASALQILLVTLAHRLSVSASGTPPPATPPSVSPLEPSDPSSSMDPPFVGSTVGRHHGSRLAPPVQVPPVVSLAPFLRRLHSGLRSSSSSQ
ncbi:hypothetical protein M9458_021686, partial [Cirrhinus mrigala]